MWKVAEEMLKEGTLKRIVNYAMAVGHFIDLLNDLCLIFIFVNSLSIFFFAF